MTATAPIPIVLLHAFPFDSELFAQTTVPAPWELTTPDRRGFGRNPLVTAGDPVPPPSLDVLVADLVARLDAAGIDRLILGGVSMGGYVTLAFAARHPERLAGLVLADTRSTCDREVEREGRLSIADRADSGEIASGDDTVTALLAPDADPSVRARTAAIAGRAAPPSIAWAQRAMANRADTTEALAALRVPVLVIVGEHDRVTPPSSAEWMADATAEATLVVIPGAGHLTPAEAPALFNAALGDWLHTSFVP